MPYGGALSSLARQVTTHSAVNPCLWASLVISLPLFYFSNNTEGWKSIAYFCIALLPIVTFIFSFIYLLFTNPRYLRSEAFQLKAEAMGMFGDKDNPLKANADNLVAMISNPTLPSLPAPGKDND